MVPSPTTQSRRWWGEFEIPPGLAARFLIGPLKVWVEPLEHEWRLAYEESAEDPSTGAVEVTCPVEPETPPGTELERFVSKPPDGHLIVSPQLADRPMVSRPEMSFRLAPGSEATLYVGTRLWARFESAGRRQRMLELPILRPSDTWFGPSTTEGELCYASRTSARLRPENVPWAPWRALTEVRLKNRGGDDLVLERLSLPVPNLALFVDAEERLWTQSLEMERREDGKLAEVRIDDGPPKEAAGATRLSEPRAMASHNIFSRALNTFLG